MRIARQFIAGIIDYKFRFRSPDRDGRKKKRGSNYDEWYVLEGRKLKVNY